MIDKRTRWLLARHDIIQFMDCRYLELDLYQSRANIEIEEGGEQDRLGTTAFFSSGLTFLINPS